MHRPAPFNWRWQLELQLGMLSLLGQLGARHRRRKTGTRAQRAAAIRHRLRHHRHSLAAGIDGRARTHKIGAHHLGQRSPCKRSPLGLACGRHRGPRRHAGAIVLQLCVPPPPGRDPARNLPRPNGLSRSGKFQIGITHWPKFPHPHRSGLHRLHLAARMAWHPRDQRTLAGLQQQVPSRLHQPAHRCARQSDPHLAAFGNAHGSRATLARTRRQHQRR